MSFSRSKRNQSVNFWMQTLFKILHVKKILFQNLTRCLFPIWRVVKLLNQILICCIFFKFKIWQVVKLFIQNLLVKPSLQFVAELLSRKNLCDNEDFLRWKDFLPVCGMCLSDVWHYLFGSCVLYGAWVLDGWDDYIICTTNWFVQNSLEFRNWLFHQDFVIKDTEILVYLPWQSKKQSTIFISSNSNLVFLNCSILSANTDPLVCVDLVFRKELNNYFLYSFLKSFFSAMLGILSTPLFCWLKWTALCKLSKNCQFLTAILPLRRYLKKVYRQSTCW